MARLDLLFPLQNSHARRRAWLVLPHPAGVGFVLPIIRRGTAVRSEMGEVPSLPRAVRLRGDSSFAYTEQPLVARRRGLRLPAVGRGNGTSWRARLVRQHLQSSGGETLCRGAGRFADSLHPDDARETDGEEIAGACKRVLIVAEAPGLEDFPDPVLPRGSSAEQVRLGLEREARALRERGYTVDLALARAEVTAADDLAAALAGKAYDCIVVGGGLRAEPGMTLAFEAVMNVLRERAPNARLAFNRAPGGAADAVERQLRRAEPSSRLRG